MTRLPVVFNPAARGGRSRPPRDALAAVASRFGVILEWWRTEAPGHAADLAARAAREGYPALAVWGGDGTYNEAARGLLGTATALIALPGGTTSVLAWELGIPRDPAAALAALLAGRRRSMAVGRTDQGQIVLLMLSAGPDVLILQRTPNSLKRSLGKIGIGVQAVAEFVRGRLPRFAVTIAGRTDVVGWCVIGNARSYGGRWHATPGADPFTPGFEVVALETAGRAAAAGFFLGLVRGRHLARTGVTRRQADLVSLEGDGVAYQIDGDVAGKLPVRLEPAAEGLWVMVPGRERP